jgi:hypothetical protein
VDCEKEIKLYRVIQVTSLPSLSTHSPVDLDDHVHIYLFLTIHW